MRILFISRAYPPIIGGIENQNHALATWLSQKAEVTTIANKYGKKFLPLFLPYALLVSIVLAPKYDRVLLGDGVLAIVGFILKRLYPRRYVVSIVHGLDMSYRNSFYQKYWVRIFLPSLDALISVSKATAAIGKQHGIPAKKFFIIPNGIAPHPDAGVPSLKELENFLDELVSGKKILLTIGRLNKRKGVEWFIRKVLPSLPDDFLYLVAGGGKEKIAIQKAIKESSMEQKVRLLGVISPQEKYLLLRTAHLFIQPNIAVKHDIEGFGIALIEASIEGLPVIASDIEGLSEAITDKKNGLLVESGNPEAFQNAIKTLLKDENGRKEFGKQGAVFTATHYHWNVISARYFDFLTGMGPVYERRRKRAISGNETKSL